MATIGSAALDSNGCTDADDNVTGSTEDDDGDSIPDIYDIELSLETRMQVYSEEMLPRVLCSDVNSALLSYVVINIDPSGWEAVWKSSRNNNTLGYDLDFLVEVLDVSQYELVAVVKLLRCVSRIPSEALEAIEELINQQSLDVNLLDIYPVYNPYQSALLDTTCEVLEHVRFFYENLWRPWDADDDDTVFVDKYLAPRMKLYEDRCCGRINRTTAHKLDAIFKEAKDVYMEMNKLQDQLHVSDSDTDLSEQEVRKCMALNMRHEELVKQLELMEDPLFRSIVETEKAPHKPCPHGHRAGGGVVTHLVSHKLTLETIQNLDEPVDTVIKVHDSLSAAVAAIYEGDTILIFPGVYQCEGLGWLDDSITIRGLGVNPCDVILEGSSGDVILINSLANEVSLHNVTINLPAETDCGLMVHYGRLTMTSCEIIGGRKGLAVLQGAELVLRNTCIRDASVVGVEMLLGAEVTLESNRIMGCGLAAVAVQVEGYDNDGCDRTRVTLRDNSLYQNQGCGLVFMAGLPNADKLATSDITEGSRLSETSFENLEMILEGTNTIEKNQRLDVGIARPIVNVNVNVIRRRSTLLPTAPLPESDSDEEPTDKTEEETLQITQRLQNTVLANDEVNSADVISLKLSDDNTKCNDDPYSDTKKESKDFTDILIALSN